MVHQSLIFLLFLLLVGPLRAQDERYYRQILGGGLPKQDERVEEASVTQFNVSGAAYYFDLNQDKLEEVIRPQKRDGVDWLEISHSSGTKIFEAKLQAMGAESSIYKIKVVNISQTVRAAIIFLDEGYTKGRKFESTARIFVLSFENNDLSKMVLTEGPHHFHEKEAQRDQYWRRDLMVNVYDIDGDGIREITVQYNSIQRIMKYKGNGEWKRI